MCAEESSCPTSLDDVGADIWRPDLLIDFQDELNIIAQDIFELKPANWDYLGELYCLSDWGCRGRVYCLHCYFGSMKLHTQLSIKC